MEDQRGAAAAVADPVQGEHHDRWSPASISWWIEQSNVATASSSSTAPSSVERNGSPVKRWSVGPASWRQTASWWSARTLTPRCAASRSIGQVLLVVATEKDTSGGSRLTEVNELAAIPVSWPRTWAATATTPLGKAPNARAEGMGVEVGARSGSRS